MGAEVNAPTADSVFDDGRRAYAAGLMTAGEDPETILAVAGSVGFELIGEIEVVGDAFVFVGLVGDRNRSLCKFKQLLFRAVHWPELGMESGDE